MTKNIIAFQKGFVITPKIGVDNRIMAMNTQSELMQFGFMLNEDAFQQLAFSDAADIKDFFNEVIGYLKEITGGTRNYQPIYRGFPEQVMGMSEYQLWVNQIIGYFSGGSFEANEWTKEKGTAFEHTKYKIISSGNEDNFKAIFKTLASSGQSLTPNDMKVIEWFIEYYPEIEFPEVIPFKENLCTIFGKMIQLNKKAVKLPKLTTTDVLRIIVYLSGGDISLPKVPRKTRKVVQGWRKTIFQENPEREKFKFKKFNRTERRYILSLLDHSNLDTKEMKLKDQRWIRIGEILHPGDYHEEFPRVYQAFQRIRNVKVRSWYSDVDREFEKSFINGLNKLSERPGEFLRRLDYLIRTTAPSMVSNIVNTFSKIAEKASNKVLLEVYTHFEKRRNPVTNRSIMIKGARKKTPLPNLPAISAQVVDIIQDIIWTAIKNKFTLLPKLGDCWIDENLKKIPLPTNMRSMNDSLVPAIRGERFPIFNPSAKTVRCFVHWFDPEGILDIDLHGFLLGTKTVSFGYNGIHNDDIGCYSGDVRHRQGACAEYVDINIDAAKQEGFKYFVMVVHNFNGGSLSDIKDCVVGTMEREYPNANNTWLPSTIQNSMKVEGAARLCLVGVYDLITGEYIHLDLDFGDFNSYVNGHSDKFFEAIKPYIELPKLSVYNLLQWHVEARGRIVSKENAETHFLFEDFSGSYTKTLEYLGV